MNTFDTLKAMPLFANLDQETIELLGQHLTLKRYKPSVMNSRVFDHCRLRCRPGTTLACGRYFSFAVQ